MLAMKRCLTIVDGSHSSSMDVDVNTPTKNGDQEFECRYALHWPDSAKEGSVYGVDAIQALQLTFNIIAMHLYTSVLHKQGRISWEAPGEGYGFPLPASMRGLAQGADQSL